MRHIAIFVILILLVGFSACNKANDYQSASYKRFLNNPLRYEKFNEFYTKIKTTPITGIGFQEGVARRDPSSIIKVDGLYYVWYTRTPEGIPVVGRSKANDTLRAYPWDLADIYYATSPDGYNWTEKGKAVGRGNKGDYDGRTVFTPDILVANNKYYLFYQAAGSLKEQGWSPKGSDGGDFVPNVLGLSWADSPNGPWHKAENPVLEVGDEQEWDSNVVHDPCLIAREGKFFLYYKSSPRVPWLNLKEGDFAPEYGDIDRAIIGVAIAESPEGPYVKSKYNPVLLGGHECIMWPYKKGVCAMLSEGPEKNSIQFAEDGINFYPVAHGIEVPKAGGTFRAGNYTDTDEKDGQGITWGLYQVIHNDWNYIKRFDCNLSLKHGEKKAIRYEKVRNWMDGKIPSDALNSLD